MRNQLKRANTPPGSQLGEEPVFIALAALWKHQQRSGVDQEEGGESREEAGK